MTELAIDYSFSRPAPAAIKAAGVAGVIRYTTGDKAITRVEAEVLRALGIWIALVRETDPSRINTAGSDGGMADAVEENGFADELGYPADAVIFYACDTTPSRAGAFAYFTGVRAAHRTRLIGWYGGMQVGLALKAAGLVDVVWVANAASWSGFRHFDELAPVARQAVGVSMLQSTVRTLPGLNPSSYDLDEVLVPFPAWGSSPAPAPAPPKPIPPVTIGLPGETMSATRVVTMPLDEHGNGTVDVPGVKYADRRAVSVDGVHNPPDKPAGYVAIPRVAFDEVTSPLRVVIEGGVPEGRYVILVAHA